MERKRGERRDKITNPVPVITEEGVNLVKKLTQETGMSETELLNEMLAVITWLRKQSGNGRVIAAVDEKTEDYIQLISPLFKLKKPDIDPQKR